MAGRETQERLIDTAERLFAEHGFDGVTFKQITTEAGQRNASALQYHFGTKQALVQAIVMRRMPTLNDRRHALLDAIEASDRDQDLREIVGAMVYPLAEQLDDGSGPDRRFYIRFLSQVLSNPRSRLQRFVPREQNSGVIRAGTMVALLMSNLPPEIIRQRLAVLPGFVVGALADYERGLLGDAGIRPNPQLFASNLVDAVVGMLEQPVSAETSVALEEDEKPKPGESGAADTDPALG